MAFERDARLRRHREPAPRSSGDLALDFVNTVADRRSKNPEELLPEFEDLVRWSGRKGAIDAGAAAAILREAAADPGRARQALRSAHALRETIFSAFANGPDDDILARLSTLHDQALRHRRLIRSGESVAWAWESRGLDRMTWPVVLAATNLLTSEVRGRVRECAGASCRSLFIDDSRRRNRRWCDMATCGNREKARRHHARVARVGEVRAERPAAPIPAPAARRTQVPRADDFVD